MIDYIDIFITFIKIGAVNFGGGYSMLPLLQEELVNRKQWTTDQELLDYFSIGQCTPGIIAINVSTFIGYKKKGILGALCSTLGFVTIPLFIIILIATFLTNFSHIPLVRHAFAGIRVCVFVLIIQAIQRLWKKSIVNKQTLLIFLVVLGICILSLITPISIPTAIIVITAGIYGAILGKDSKEETSL